MAKSSSIPAVAFSQQKQQLACTNTTGFYLIMRDKRTVCYETLDNHLDLLMGVPLMHSRGYRRQRDVLEFSAFIPDSTILAYCGIGDERRKFVLVEDRKDACALHAASCICCTRWEICSSPGTLVHLTLVTLLVPAVISTLQMGRVLVYWIK